MAKKISQKNTLQSDYYPDAYFTDSAYLKDQSSEEAQRAIRAAWNNWSANLMNEDPEDPSCEDAEPRGMDSDDDY